MSILWAGFSSASRATLFPNPDPAQYAPDVDGNGLFYFGQLTLSPKLRGYGAFNFIGAGFEFGFYFAGDPITRISIFDPLDVTPPTTTVPVQGARIAFNTGDVYDIDAGDAVQDSFTTVISSQIGFYVYAPAPGVSVPLFTQTLLNPGGANVSGAYRGLDSPFT